MRQLTKSQKNIIEGTLKYHEPTADEKSLFSKMNPIRTADDLPDEVWDELVKINDTEILWQNVNSFIQDWRMAQIRD